MLTKIISPFKLIVAVLISLAVFSQTNSASNVAVESSADCHICKSSLSFAGKKAKQYQVGNNIPNVPFKTKTSWAGLMPVKGPKIQDAALFFWLWGQDSVKSGEDLVIWLAGGPGCSASLGGMMEQSGPFRYRYIHNNKTIVNQYSWTKVANIVYVENPVGVSLSVGESDDHSSEDAAIDFVSFLENFYTTFPELRKKKLWLSGESWAGKFIPYLQAKLVKMKPKNVPKVQGALVIDGFFTTHNVSEDLVAYQFAKVNQKMMKLNDKALANVKAESDRCNLTNYLDRNLHYPPRGRLPDFSSDGCTPWEAALTGDFNAYNIADPESTHEDSLAFGAIPAFFRNATVQKYIHSPKKDEIKRCVRNIFYPNDDQSLAPDRSPNFEHPLLAQMIEQNSKTIFISSEYDFKLITNGTALALQNLTWNKAQGFSKPPLTPVFDVERKQRGFAVTERGLTFASIKGSGHFLGEDLPATSLAAIRDLIGKGDWTKK